MKEKYVVKYWCQYDTPEPQLLYTYEFPTFAQAAQFQSVFTNLMQKDFEKNSWTKKYFWFTCEKEVIE